MTPAESAAGWKLLFDGKTLKGWIDPAKQTPPGDSFRIEDGAIASVAHPKFREDMLTTEKFTNFELSFEWKISPGGNSGVKYLVQDAAVIHPSLFPTAIPKFEDRVDYLLKNKRAKRSSLPSDGKVEIYQVAYEYQVIDNTAHADAKRSQKSWAGALYQLVEPQGAGPKLVGEWNEGRIVVRGNRVEHWLNGVKVVDASLDDPAVAAGLAKRWTTKSPVYELLTKRPHAAGPIVLQNHNDAAWYRSLKIRRIL
ncbi:MAG: DUF1080 domain-containing protein [Bryobacteraceae bacterium]|nr:DUF1080 domain-containing protein [Bryobacteraceae bacterium]